MKRLRSHFVCEHYTVQIAIGQQKRKGNGLKQADVKSFAIALCRTEDNS
jgi:hypothetical protein